MNNWYMAHPWMTFFMAIATIEAMQSVIKYVTGWHKTDKEVELEILKENKE